MGSKVPKKWKKGHFYDPTRPPRTALLWREGQFDSKCIPHIENLSQIWPPWGGVDPPLEGYGGLYRAL